MKISWLIQNRKKRRESPRVSLFPFLAVLICTMGALVLLLLTVTRQARLQAAKAAAAHDGQRAQALQADLDMAAWRVEQLKKSRSETEQQLAEARLVLGHLEDHDRRLRQQLTDLKEKRDRAGASLEMEQAKANSDATKLEQLEAQLAQAERNLAMAAQKAGQQKHGYSIVPYNGPNQTRRRPIYIECTGDAVVIQPEGISFTESDFDGPLGPGNPLAAAVRAAREYMLLQSRGMPGAREPYPLLLVRPTGIAAYEAAMAALQSWGSEFGYEFVNNDWNLAYPPPDPGLAKTMNDAVAIARAEHDRLIAAAPSKYGKRPRPGAYRANGGDDGPGGESAAGGSGGQSNSSSPGFYASHPAGHAGQGHGFGSGDDDGGIAGNGSGNGSGNGTAGNTYGRGASLTDHNPYASIGTPGSGSGGPNIGAVAYGGGGYPGGTPGGYPGGGNGSGTVGYQGGTGGGYPGGGYPGGGNAGGGYAGGMSGSPGGTGLGGNGGQSNGGQGAGGMGAGGPSSGGMGTGNGSPGSGGDGTNNFGSGGGAAGGSPGGSPNGQPGLPGISSQFGSNGQPASQVASQGGSAGSGPGGTSGYGQTAGGQASGTANGPPPPTPEGYLAGRPNDGQQQPPPPNNVAGRQPLGPLRPGEYRPADDTPPKKLTPEEEEKLKKDKRRLADKQDVDWGLRSHAPRAAAISRPVHVDCYADRLVIVPEPGEGHPMVIALGPQSERTVDAMIVDVWQLIDVWGIAGSNMYWRPVMQFYVAPGAEPRFNEVAHMMDGSGLKIERKQ